MKEFLDKNEKLRTGEAIEARIHNGKKQIKTIDGFGVSHWINEDKIRSQKQLEIL